MMRKEVPDEGLNFTVLARLFPLLDGNAVSPIEHLGQVSPITWNNLPSLIKELPRTKIKREFERNRWPKFEKAVAIAAIKREDHVIDIERRKELLILGKIQEPDYGFKEYVNGYKNPEGIVLAYVPGIWKNIVFLARDKTIRTKGVVIVTPELIIWCDDLKIRHLKEKIKVSQEMETAINFARKFFSSQ